VAVTSQQPSVERVGELTDEVFTAVQRLVSQLSTSAKPPSREAVAALVSSPGTALLVVRSPAGELVGMTTLATMGFVTGVRCYIEDVVVDTAHRRQGLARAMMDEAVAMAKEAGARTLELTSRPSREAANNLYLKMGFERRDTNVYRLSL
jgi:ribosomal protein S18 acetylase RimI-like enzyme